MNQFTVNTAGGYGRVEIYSTSWGQWGTVCDDRATNTNADVVCRSLGFSSGVSHSRAFYGQGTGPIVMDDVLCYGSESSLPSCLHSTNHNCGHHEDWGVECSGTAPPQPNTIDSGGSSSNSIGSRSAFYNGGGGGGGGAAIGGAVGGVLVVLAIIGGIWYKKRSAQPPTSTVVVSTTSPPPQTSIERPPPQPDVEAAHPVASKRPAAADESTPKVPSPTIDRIRRSVSVPTSSAEKQRSMAKDERYADPVHVDELPGLVHKDVDLHRTASLPNSSTNQQSAAAPTPEIVILAPAVSEQSMPPTLAPEIVVLAPAASKQVTSSAPQVQDMDRGGGRAPATASTLRDGVTAEAPSSNTTNLTSKQLELRKPTALVSAKANRWGPRPIPEASKTGLRTLDKFAKPGTTMIAEMIKRTRTPCFAYVSAL